MSCHRMRLASSYVTCCLTILIAAPISAAQAEPEKRDDSFDRAKATAEVVSQKAEADIRKSLREAQRMTDPTAAIAQLEGTINLVDDNPQLSDTRRETLRRMIKDRIRVTKLEKPGSRSDESTDNAAKQVKRNAAAAEREATQDAVRRYVDGLKKLQLEGRNGNGGSNLSPKAAADPVVQAANRITDVSSQVAANRQLQNERDKALSGVLQGVERSALPPKGDVEFPKDWREKTKNRKGVDEVPLTAAEKAIFAALNSTISVDFKNSRFEDVLEYLQAITGKPILAVKPSLDDAGVTYDTTVTLKMKGTSLRTVLRKILGDLGLTYVIRNEVLEITTPARAKEQLVARTYYIRDLAINPWQVAQLIDLIHSSIDSQSWNVNGGPASIAYHPITGSLVIKQSTEFHATFYNTLR